MTDSALAKKPLVGIDAIKVYAKLDQVAQAFIDVLGEAEARSYISEVLVQCRFNEKLVECSPKSIMMSALRCAGLRLSVDPALRQAHLVPYGKECKLIIDYHGYVNLMDRTELYEIINVLEIWPGEEVHIDRFSGRVAITGVATSRKEGDELGWCAYWKETNGRERFLYMANDQIIAHVLEFNPAGYNNPKGIWKGKNARSMFRKTPLRILASQWGQFKASDARWLKADEVNGDVPELPDDKILEGKSREAVDTNKLLAELGYGDPIPVEHDAEPPITPAPNQPELPLDPPARVWTEDEIYAAVVDAKLAPDLFSAKGSLAKCTTEWDTPAKASAWLKLYRPWRIAKLTSDQAAEKANNGEVWQPQ